MTSEILNKSLSEHQDIFLGIHSMFPEIEKAYLIILDALQSGRQILVAGNGGSASDAQHFAAELVGKFEFDRIPLKAIALNTDTSSITAIGNDYGFDMIFSRQVEALANPGDVFIAITTSGNSKNISKAINMAQELGVIVILLSGATGGFAEKMLQKPKDHSLIINSDRTARIQEAHIFILHMLCELIDCALNHQK